MRKAAGTLRNESRIPRKNACLWLLRTIRTNRANRNLVVVGHIGIHIPHPLQRTCALRKGGGNLALKLPAFDFGAEAQMVVLRKPALLAGLLNQHWLSGKLCRERSPQNRIEIPPRVVCGKVNQRRIERRRKTVADAILFLPHGNQLLRTVL